jgi:type IV pilus assembly protein PilA
MFCAQCGAPNDDQAQFCVKCGTLVQAAPAAGSGQPAPGVVTPSGWPAPPANISSYAVPGQAYTGPTQTSGKAIGSLICGILFLLFPFAIGAVVLGHLSLSDIRKAAGRLTGRGLATTGLVLGYLGLSFIPILIIAAIAIPNLLRARMAAYEASAVESLRTINTTNVEYYSTYSNGYAPSLGALGGAPGETADCNHALLIEFPLTVGKKSGYIFTYTAHPPANGSTPALSPEAAAKGCTTPGSTEGYSVAANPVQTGTTGQRSFYTDASGTIRYSTDGTPNAQSTPIN